MLSSLLPADLVKLRVIHFQRSSKRRAGLAAFCGVLLLALCGASLGYAQSRIATTTTLAVTSGGSTVSSVPSGSVVTLTATVNGGGAAVSRGQVNFCDATATYCTDIHKLGTAQLTGAGTAMLKFRPGMGSHSYKAIFSGTNGASPSTSDSASLTVSGTIPTVSTLTASGSAGNYTLTAKVSGAANPGQFIALSGNVSFLDVTNGNFELGTAPLVDGPPVAGWLNSQSPATGVEPYSIAVGDFNGDGIADFAVANSNYLNTDPINSPNGTVTIFLGSGDGTFVQAPHSPVTVGKGPFDIAAGDFNGDGKQDLVTCNFVSQSITILMGDGTGAFTEAANSPFLAGGYSDAFSVAVADLNGDGIADLAVTGWGDPGVSIHLGNNDGTFAPPTFVQLGPPFVGILSASVVAGDFNGDGKTDLAVENIVSTTNAIPSVFILLGNGDGTFQQAPFSPFVLTADPFKLVSGDFNGDGIADLAVLHSGGNLMEVLLGLGNGTFTQAANSPFYVDVLQAPRSIALGDFNADGKTDLVLANLGANSVPVLLGNGDGTFTPAPASPVSTGTQPNSIAVGDFNGDGLPDFVTANLNANTATVMLTQLNQNLTAQVTGISPLGTGTHQVVATFGASGDFAASTSAPISIAASKGSPKLTVTPATMSMIATQSLQVTVALSGGPANPSPTGSVTLTSGKYTSAAGSISNGSAVITIPGGSLPAGNDVLTASYSPDTASSALYAAATGVSGSVTVTTAMPTITVTPAQSSITTIQSLAVTITLAGTPTPSGSVTLTAGNYTSASTTLAGGSVTFTIPAGSLAVGTNTLTASYVPDSTSSSTYSVTVYTSSRSNVTVSRVLPTLSLTPSATVITNQQSLTVAVSVSLSGQPAPSGSVTLASGSYSQQLSLASGATSFSIPAGTLSSGANTLTATYAGDLIYSGTTGTSTVTVSPVVVSSTNPTAVSPGGSASTTITLFTGSSYSGTVNLSCALTGSPTGAQSLPACSLNPASVTLTTGAGGTSTMSVTTKAASSALLRPEPLWGRAAGGAALAVLLIWFVPVRRRRWIWMLMLLCVVAAAGAIGCGGGGGSSTAPPVTQTTPATTAGSYVFTVTAVDSGNSTITSSATVSLKVN